MKTAKIKINGPAGTGKSTLAWLIKSSLAEYGINCVITGCEDEREGAMDKTWKLRLAAFKNQTVEVETIMTHRQEPNNPLGIPIVDTPVLPPNTAILTDGKNHLTIRTVP